MQIKRKNKPKKSKLFLFLFLFFLVFVATGLAAAYIILPDVGKLKGSIKIDRKVKNGNDWENVPFMVGEKNPNFVHLNNISKHLIHAVIVAEDIEFYSHNGFNFQEIQQSIKKNIQHFGFVRGGSTITQQLMKNVYLSGDKNLYRKILEAVLTYKAEKTLTKNRILELYLNIIEWGDGIYGIKEASHAYFKKDPSGLTPTESAYLASLIPGPKKFSKAKPGSKMYTYLQKRRNTILWWMEKAGYLTADDEKREEKKEEKKPAQEIKKGSARQPEKALAKAEKVAPKPPEKPEPKPTISQDEEKELLNMVEEFQPEEVFKETKTFESPAEQAADKKKK